MTQPLSHGGPITSFHRDLCFVVSSDIIFLGRVYAVHELTMSVIFL